VPLGATGSRETNLRSPAALKRVDLTTLFYIRHTRLSRGWLWGHWDMLSLPGLGRLRQNMCRSFSCPVSGVSSIGACRNSPLHEIPPGYEGQRPFAGSLRVSLGFSLLLSPKSGGLRGLKRDRTDYPPLRGHDEAWPSEVAERCSGTLPGVLGVPPNPLFSIPQEWGIRRLTKPPMATEPSSPPGSGRTR